jgi:hypothetical protein
VNARMVYKWQRNHPWFATRRIQAKVEAIDRVPEANAALRSTARRDSGESYEEFLTRRHPPHAV